MASIIPSNISFDSYNNKVYPFLMNTNGLLSVIFGGLGIYITWFWSPKSFGKYKYFLFNISFWSFLLDSFFTFLYSPWPLFPAIVLCPVGFLKTTNPILARIWYEILLFLFGGTTMAVLSAFIYRFATLKGIFKNIMSAQFLTFLAILHIIFALPTNTLLNLAISNITAVDDTIVKVSNIFSDYFSICFQRYPNIIKYFPNKDMACTTISLDVGFPYNYLFIMFLGAGFIIPVPIIAILIYKTLILLRNQKSMMSEKTYLMHRELFKTLIFQFAVPGGTIFVPYVITITMIIFSIGDIAIVFQAAYLFGTLHSTMNTVMMLCFIKPFRNQFLKVLRHHSIRASIEKFKAYSASIPMRNDDRVYTIVR